MTDLFTWQAGDVEVSQCLFCSHWRQGSCAAFPGGVPFDILANRIDHRDPVQDDRGIRFEPRSSDAARHQATIFERKHAGIDRGVRRVRPADTRE